MEFNPTSHSDPAPAGKGICVDKCVFHKQIALSFIAFTPLDRRMVDTRIEIYYSNS